MRTDEKIRLFFPAMLSAYGPQGWWPAETPFEVVIGAILTQNTNWKNVEQAIANLKREGLLDAAALAAVADERLAEVIRPAGYYRLKAKRLKNFIRLLTDEFGGDLDALFALRTAALRERVLGVTGIGPETADSIVLYAAGRPVFVVDAYTARLFYRHGMIEGDATYEDIQSLIQGALADDVALFQECHALLVEVGKRHCKKRAAECGGCPLKKFLEEGQPVREMW
ncbi:MAG: endonuclease III domain-containing protein [Planctomycetota bacterium]|nr:endonuclease III domain-containing protein [Planctomycetota bacterium]